MPLEACNSAITAAVGRELTDREKGAVARHARFLKRKIDLANGPDEVEAALKDFGEQIISKYQIQRRNTALNYQTLIRQTERRRNIAFMAKNPAEAMKGLFRGSLFDYEGSKNGLAPLVDHEATARTQSFLADLEREKLGKYAFSGKDDENIGKAIWAIRNEQDPARYGKEASTVATIIEKHQESLRLALNKVGSWTGRASDYIARQSHDSYKIARAGGNMFRSDASFRVWTDALKNLDWNKSFDGDLADASTDEKLGRLRSLYNQFTSGKHLHFSGPEEKAPIPARGFQNIGARFSHERQLVFQRPEDYVAYNRLYGHGDSIAEAVHRALNNGGRDIALMKEWGVNPRLNMEKFHEDWQADLNRENRADDMDALNKAFAHEIKTTWPNITDEVGNPGSSTAARYVSAGRSLLVAARLGLSIFSALGDLPLRASMLNMYGSRTSGDFFKNLLKATKDQFTPSELSQQDRRDLAAEMGIRMEAMHLPLNPNHADSIGFGAMAKLNQAVMRYSLHSFWSNRLRTNALAADGFRHWTMRGKTFDQLPVGTQALFRQFGITKDGWDIMRQQPGDDLGQSRRIFSPSGILDLDKELFRPLVKDGTDTQLERARQQLSDRYRNLLGEMADRITTSPSRANRALMNQGIKAGTVEGELLRGFMMLKGFAVNYMRNQVGRELLGYSPDKVGISRAIWRTMTFQPGTASARMGLIKLIGAGVTFGYISNALRDIATGKTPENPVGDHWGDAMQRAFARQSLGLYTDFLLGEHRQDASFWERVGDTLAGPEEEAAADTFNMINKIVGHATKPGGYRENEFYKDAAGGLGLLYRNTPGNNLFWTKYATDFLILNNLSEQLNPGFQRRLINRAQKERGQQYLLGAGPQTAP